jgi:predicted small metal-binding protein
MATASARIRIANLRQKARDALKNNRRAEAARINAQATELSRLAAKAKANSILRADSELRGEAHTGTSAKARVQVSKNLATHARTRHKPTVHSDRVIRKLRGNQADQIRSARAAKKKN